MASDNSLTFCDLIKAEHFLSADECCDWAAGEFVAVEW